MYKRHDMDFKAKVGHKAIGDDNYIADGGDVFDPSESRRAMEEASSGERRQAL